MLKKFCKIILKICYFHRSIAIKEGLQKRITKSGSTNSGLRRARVNVDSQIYLMFISIIFTQTLLIIYVSPGLSSFLSLLFKHIFESISLLFQTN